MSRILIVDDDPQIRLSFEKLLLREKHEILTASSAESGVRMVRADSPDLVITDVRLPGMDGLEFFKEIIAIEPKLPVIIMTAYGTTETAIQATKMGAFDYILKPFDIPSVLDMIRQALQAGRFMRNRIAMDVEPREAPPEALIGKCSAMQDLYKAIGRVAPTDATVLIRGESGTGKELLARAIYQHSMRAEKPFTVINCVAIPDTLLESELFGYERGAFTGAVNRRLGKIEQAHKGTVFLDEIGDMPIDVQSKILRLLQERSIERLGGGKPISVDVRIIAATNRDLETAVAEGRFREDLYYRLKVVTLTSPPLANRDEDVSLLAEYFLARFSKEMGVPNPGLTDNAKAALLDYNWPGNVRELANTLQNCLIFNTGAPIASEAVLQATGRDKVVRSGKDGAAQEKLEENIREWIKSELVARTGDNLYDQLADHFGALMIKEALKITDGNRTRASKLLGLSRPTLLAKIQKYGVNIDALIT